MKFMSEKINISWCDSTINFWTGCTKVSAGCTNCYAEARDARMMQEKVSHWGKGAPRLKHKGAVKDALAMNRKPWICDDCGQGFASEISPAHAFKPEGKSLLSVQICKNSRTHRRRIFSLSLGDWLDAEVPIEWLAEMLDTIRQCDQVTWILCTKRPELFWHRLYTDMTGQGRNYPELMGWILNWVDGRPPNNIILLTSVENNDQKQRIVDLLKIPAACRGLSVEPMLGPVEFSDVTKRSDAVKQLFRKSLEGIDWVIFGGESGPNARPCNVDWIRDGVAQCRAAGVAAFVKQLGAMPFTSGVSGLGSPDGNQYVHKLNLTDKKGGDMDEWSEDLRVQEWPKLPACHSLPLKTVAIRPSNT